jgi:Domain of unknown function (DUF4338)
MKASTEPRVKCSIGCRKTDLPIPRGLPLLYTGTHRQKTKSLGQQMNKVELRSLIITSLETQGFRVDSGRIVPPQSLDKEAVRQLHGPATRHRIDQAKPALAPLESDLLQRLAAGHEVDPEQMRPRLVEVQRGSQDELLFRYVSLHWSIPVSSGYGRRLRFLVMDDSNQKLIGLLGLGDPVFNLGPRDAWIGWSSDKRISNLRHVMDAFVVGAVPPYSFLLGGKLVAMLAASNEIRQAFRRKYGNRRSLILQRRCDPELALITTASALGRSSIYNRIRYHDGPLFRSIGYTSGSGDFHFSDGLYAPMSAYARRYCEPTAKNHRWGSGFRNKREVIKKCLKKVGLSTEWIYHGVRRELFVVPLASNCREFLTGCDRELLSFDYSSSDLGQFFKERWLLPRARRDERYRLWQPSDWSLWTDSPEI